MAASARRSEYDSAATVVGSDRTLTLNVEIAGSLASHGKAHNRFVAHFNAFTRMAIVSNLVPCLIGSVPFLMMPHDFLFSRAVVSLSTARRNAAGISRVRANTANFLIRVAKCAFVWPVVFGSMLGIGKAFFLMIS